MALYIYNISHSPLNTQSVQHVSTYNCADFQPAISDHYDVAIGANIVTFYCMVVFSQRVNVSTSDLDDFDWQKSSRQGYAR